MLKRFISYYKPHLGLFLADMLCAAVVAGCGLLFPTVARTIINDYAPSGNLRALLISSLFLLFLYIVKAWCNYFVGYYGHIVGVRMQADMRRDLFRKYESLPTSYFDKHKTGDLLSRLVGDLFDVSELAHHGPENLFISVLMLVGSFRLLFRIHKGLTLIMFAVIPFIVVFTVLSRRAMMRAMKKSRVQIAEVNADVENSVAGIRETKTYAREAYEMEKFEAGNRRFAAYRTEAMHSLGLFNAVMTFFSDLLYLLVIAVGGLFLYYGSVSVGDFAAFVLYISMFLDPIKRFATLFEQMQEGMSGFSRFCEVMDEVPEEDAGTKELSDVRGDVLFEDVTFRYDSAEGAGRDVISHLNLHIPAGETLALVGPSGGGKTTLCHLLVRFYPTSGGRILIDGTDIRDVKLSSLRKNVGIVSQNVFLFDGTVRDNIAYGAEGATDGEVEAAACRAHIHDDILAMEKGYDTHVGERGVRLSGGQKQRIAIARVFLKNPKLLILDEATSALDNVTELQIQSALEELSRGRTVLVVAHRLSTVRGADEIVYLDDKGIAERGTHEELLAKDGRYAALCRAAESADAVHSPIQSL